MCIICIYDSPPKTSVFPEFSYQTVAFFAAEKKGGRIFLYLADLFSVFGVSRAKRKIFSDDLRDPWKNGTGGSTSAEFHSEKITSLITPDSGAASPSRRRDRFSLRRRLPKSRSKRWLPSLHPNELRFHLYPESWRFRYRSDDKLGPFLSMSRTLGSREANFAPNSPFRYSAKVTKNMSHFDPKFNFFNTKRVILAPARGLLSPFGY